MIQNLAQCALTMLCLPGDRALGSPIQQEQGSI
jgi:hypothetical protein